MRAEESISIGLPTRPQTKRIRSPSKGRITLRSITRPRTGGISPVTKARNSTNALDIQINGKPEGSGTFRRTLANGVRQTGTIIAADTINLQ